MIAEADMAFCRETIRHGSLSFHAASRLLPARVRDPALALYAFCRLADDAVDLQTDKHTAVRLLHRRLDLAYAGRPRDAAIDRVFAAVIDEFALPRALPEALLEGLEWDAEGRRYATFPDLCAYGARVASSVGAMMCVLMRVRDADTLARACDLGVAMQLTNIARDVGEDARAGRIYLPLDWLAAEGVDPDAFLADPRATPAIRRIVRRLLAEADRLYLRSEAGIPALPLAARTGIYAARHIYAGIGGAIRRDGCDSVAHRARTNAMQKAAWMGLAASRSVASLVTPRSAVLYARPMAETAFLVDATAQLGGATGDWGQGRAGSIVGVFAQLEAHDRHRATQRGGA